MHVDKAMGGANPPPTVAIPKTVRRDDFPGQAGRRIGTHPPNPGQLGSALTVAHENLAPIAFNEGENLHFPGCINTCWRAGTPSPQSLALGDPKVARPVFVDRIHI